MEIVLRVISKKKISLKRRACLRWLNIRVRTPLASNSQHYISVARNIMQFACGFLLRVYYDIFQEVINLSPLERFHLISKYSY